jgi:hypothetical protein
MQVERVTYKDGAKCNHNNGLIYRKQYANTQATTVQKSEDKWMMPLVR